MTLDALRKSYAGRRVLLTGHTGFKGAWLLALLDRLGARTLGYALPPETTPSLFDDLGGGTLCESVISDVCDLDRLTRTVAAFRPDVVLHLAAQSLVRRSYREPVATYASNVTGTVNVLEAVRRLDGPCATVLITTDKVYAESGRVGYAYAESDPLGGWDPYAASKACCEIVASSYRLSFLHAEQGRPLATARAGNVIGGGDWCEDRLVPDIARALSKGQSIRVRNPRSVRPWQHVLEPLVGYLTLGAALLDGRADAAEAFNFGPDAGDALPVERVVQESIKAWCDGAYHVDADPDAPHESAFLQIDSAKARRVLGWRPRWDAATAIARTVEWYRRAPAAGPLDFTRRQIEGYFA